MRRILPFVVFVAFAACEKKLAGPVPAVDGVLPVAVCQQQLDTVVTVSGDRLAPLLTGALVDGERQLELPRVSLVPAQALDGSALEGAPLALTDDPKEPAASLVRWSSQQSMAFTVTPALQVPVGLHDVVVENAQGARATLRPGLLALPPPTLSASTPDLVCGEQACTVVLSGEGFVKAGAAQPTVRIGTVELAPTAMEQCAALPGPAGYERCQAIRLVIPAHALPLGNHPVTVTNPAPVHCVSSEPVTLTVVPAPVVRDIVSDLVCVAQGSNALTVTGTGFLTVDAASPVLRFRLGAQTLELPTTASNCEPVTGPAATVQTCTALVASLPQDALAPGTWSVSVTNPTPADCTSDDPVSFLVVPPPSVASAVPDVVCSAQGGVTVTLTGTDFLVVSGQAPAVDLGTSAGLPAVASDCAALPGSTLPVERCSTLTVTVPVGAAVGAAAVVVHNPAPAGCQSTEAVGVLVVSPPTLTALAPQLACNADGAVAVTLTGEGFLTIDGVAPAVDVGGTVLGSTASGCTPLAGSTRTVERCTTLAVAVPPTVAPGALAVTVTNPAPAGCVSGAATLALFGRPEVTSVAPAGLCTSAGTTEIVVSGAGFLAVTSGGTRRLPTLEVGTQVVAATTSACAAVTGVPEVERCGELRFQVAGTAFSPGAYAVRVTNPAPIGCASQASSPATFTVTAPPTITSVLPTSICAGGDTLQLAGTGFLASAAVRLVGSTTLSAASVSVSDGGTVANASFAAGLPLGQYQVTLENDATCSATAAALVTVTPGPQLFFVDPEVAYSGLTVQATVYGSGFTLPVHDVSLLPADGGAPISLAIQQASQVNRAQVLLRNVDGGVLPAGTYAMRLDDGANCDTVLEGAVRVVDEATLVLRDLEPPFGAEGASTGVTVRADLVASGDAGFVQVPRVYLNPSNPGPGTVAAPVGAVAFVDPATLTAVVPRTLPAGSYDVIVVNPDGRVGVKTQGFVVTPPSQPPPRITGLSPGSLPNNVTSPLAIDGADFRAPLTVALRSCTDGAGASVASPSLTVTGAPTATRIDASVSNVGTAAACVVRVTNGDNGTFSDFASLVFTNASKNLYPAQNGPLLVQARRAPVALGGEATSAARFLYVLGGDSGNGAGLSSVEHSALGLIGVPGPFAVSRQGALNQGRTLAGGARLGRWLYVAGGIDGATRLASVERASILDPERRGEVVDLLIETDPGTGLAAGLYYYRVAAVMGPADGFNPGGEELASDPFPVRLPSASGLRFRVTVTWAAVPGAAKYRVFRSPLAGAAVGQEEVIAEVTSGLQFRDEGVAPMSPDHPLPIGTLSRWQTLAATLGTPREGAGVAAAIDPVDLTRAYLYVLGGRASAGTALSTYEYLPLTLNADGSQSPAVAFVSGGTNTLATQRWQVAAAVATSATSGRIAAGTSYVYALSGLRPTGVLSQSADAAVVLAGGALGTFVALPNLGRAGYAAVAAADQVFALGGNQALPDSSIDNGEICGTGNTTGFCSTNPTPPYISNWNTGQQLNVPRYLLGGVLQGAYIYVTGGVGTGGAALNSTEYRIW